MLYRIEYRYFYYDRDITFKICHVKLATYAEFEKEPTKQELVNYFNENLVNKDDDIYRNKLCLTKNGDKEEIYIEDLLNLPANIIVEKVTKDGECYITSGARFKLKTTQENIKAGVSEDYKKYGKYTYIKDKEDFKKLSKKKQERILNLISEMHTQDEETDYSEYNLEMLDSTLSLKEIDNFLKGF